MLNLAEERQTRRIMKTKDLKDFSLQTTDFSSIEGLRGEAIVNRHFGMMLNIGPYRNNFIKIGEPYRFVEGRILWVTGGDAYFDLTLEEYHMEKGDIVLLAPEAIIELKECSKDFTMMGVICKECVPVSKNLILHANDEAWGETVRLADLLWGIASQTPFRRDTVNHMLSAIISDIEDWSMTEQEAAPKEKESRSKRIFNMFKKKVNEHCCQHRDIPFYAKELALSPHHLSRLVSKESGETAMFWINRAILVRAKVLLKDKENTICDVAEKLNFPDQSAFSTYFKRETGMTPSQYRKAD